MITREPIGQKYFINVNENHRFGTDAVLLADFAARVKTVNAADLGTGCGIIPMLWAAKGRVKTATGIEIQKDGAEMFKQTIEQNCLEGMLTAVNADLKNLKGVLPFGAFDLVSCNPPYKAQGAGIISESESDKIARHETLCTLPDIAAAAKRLLKFSGRFCLCHRPERLADIISAMKNEGIEPKTLRLVIQREGEEPWLILIEGRLGGKPGMRIMPPLYIEKDGKMSNDTAKIYEGLRGEEDRRI